ncbi:hypothetical protein D083_4482 [Dickeya solani RNS 08.23.3.1.A]|nr:hypothetical protein D083_4482 [Dickeya solani RNS 08.23.3.1.A]
MFRQFQELKREAPRGCHLKCCEDYLFGYYPGDLANIAF